MRQHFVRPVTSEEEQALQQLYRQGRTHLERRRGQFILLSAKGHDLLHAAQLVGMSRKTAACTLRVFQAAGVAALRDVPPPGRVSALGPEFAGRRGAGAAPEAP